MPHRVRAVIKKVIIEELKDPKSEIRAEILAVAGDAVPEFFQGMLDGKTKKAKRKPKPLPAVPDDPNGAVKTTRLRGNRHVIIKSLPGEKRRWARGNPTPKDYWTNPWKYDVIACEFCGPDKDKTHLTKCPVKKGSQITRTWRPRVEVVLA